MTHFCWLPPDSDVASVVGPAAAHVVLLDERPGAVAHAAEQQQPRRDISGVLYSRSARFSARVKFRNEAAALAVLGDVRDAGRTIPRAPAPVRSPPSTTIAPRSTRPQAGDRLDELALAVAVDAGQGDDLARVDGQVAPWTAGRSRSSRTCRSRTSSTGSLGCARRLVDAQEDLAADHEPRERLLGRALGRDGVDALAAPQHRHAVGDLEHLVELVRDEDDRRAVGLQRLEHAEQVAAPPARSAPRSARRGRGSARRGRARAGSRRAAACRRVMSSTPASGSTASP